MSEHGWQSAQRLTVAAAGTGIASLPTGRPVLEKLTVWAVSGNRVLANVSFQPRVNGVALGSAVNVVAAAAATLVYEPASGQRLIPTQKGTLAAPSTGPSGAVNADAFQFDVLVSNAGASSIDVTVYFVGVGRDGG